MNIKKNKFLHMLLANWGEVSERAYDLAILPWGAMEPHNYHLPYLTDCILSSAIASDAAEVAYEQGVTCMVLPPVFLGSQNAGQWNKPFCVHTRGETQKVILVDIVASLHGQGIRTMVILNGHGGNSFKSHVRDLAMAYPDFRVVVVDWYNVIPKRGFFEEEVDDHAGEQETSVMLHYHPELVEIERAGDGRVTPGKIPSLEEKVGWMPRHWDEVSADTGIGYPKKATAEKGKRYVEAVVRKIAQLLVELAGKR
ncbi:MAG: creatininase family protein [Fermentimonas sp.]